MLRAMVAFNSHHRLNVRRPLVTAIRLRFSSAAKPNSHLHHLLATQMTDPYTRIAAILLHGDTTLLLYTPLTADICGEFHPVRRIVIRSVSMRMYKAKEIIKNAQTH